MNFIKYCSVFNLLLLLFVTGCSPRKAPERIDRIGKSAMGDIQHPRNGEGELLALDGSLPGGFSRMAVEVVPFEHRIFRMVLENEEVTATGDVLESSAGFLEKHFNIKFSRGDHNLLTVELPGTRILLRRAFELGARAVAVEFIDRELAAQAAKLKLTDRYLQYRKFYSVRNELILLAQAIADFKLDTGNYPEKMDELFNAPRGISSWNGPYGQTKPDASVHYRRISVDSYELYREIDGKRISEDTQL